MLLVRFTTRGPLPRMRSTCIPTKSWKPALWGSAPVLPLCGTCRVVVLEDLTDAGR